jgi:hypothetical protein
MTLVQKQHKMPSWGLDPWDPAAKAHMMAYDKQTIKRLLQRCTTRRQSSRRV